MPAGRPTKYKAEYAEQAGRLCTFGATDADLGDFFHVSEQTINAWKNKHPKFLESIKECKKIVDGMVERRLFERATGYNHPEDKIFNNAGEELVVATTKHYAPDTAAAIFWLKNRQPDKWRDKTEVATTHKFEDESDEALANRLKRLREKEGIDG